MFNIIKSDLYRLLKGKAIYITVLIMAVMLGLDIYELQPGYVGVTGGGLEQMYEEDPEEMTDMRDMDVQSLAEARKMYKQYPYELDKAILGTNANLYYLFIILIAVIISADFSKRTVKNTIASAVSRRKYYFSKLICCILTCTMLVLLNNYGMYIVNRLVNGEDFSSSLAAITKVTFYQLPIMYGIISLLVCISVVVKKGSAFNAISIPLLIVAQLVLSLFVKIFKIKSGIFNYEYQTVLGKLAGNSGNDYIVKCALLGIIYIVIFNIIGYYSFKKAEIK